MRRGGDPPRAYKELEHAGRASTPCFALTHVEGLRRYLVRRPAHLLCGAARLAHYGVCSAEVFALPLPCGSRARPPRPGLCPRIRRSRASLSPPTPGSRIRAGPPPFHADAADQARATSTPGTTWPDRYLPAGEQVLALPVGRARRVRRPGGILGVVDSAPARLTGPASPGSAVFADTGDNRQAGDEQGGEGDEDLGLELTRRRRLGDDRGGDRDRGDLPDHPAR
jgi:hypothetical protein